jgi:hypothetical protein
MSMLSLKAPHVKVFPTAVPHGKVYECRQGYTTINF